MEKPIETDWGSSGSYSPDGAKLAFAEAEAAYRAAKASDKLKVLVAPGVKHAVPPDQRQAALDWFEKWLKWRRR